MRPDYRAEPRAKLRSQVEHAYIGSKIYYQCWKFMYTCI